MRNKLLMGLVALPLLLFPVKEANAQTNSNIKGRIYVAADQSGLETKVRLLDTSGTAIDSVNTNVNGEYDFSTSAVNVDDDIFHPSNFYIFQNYPNPFNPSTNVPIHLPVPSYVEMGIYNVLGQEVASFDGRLSSGQHVFRFKPGDDCGTGVYIAQVKVDGKNFRGTRKMLLIDGGNGATSLDLSGGSFNPSTAKSFDTFSLPKVANGEYQIQVVEEGFSGFTSNPFNYDGSQVTLDVPMLEDTLHYNPQYFDSFLHMMRFLTASNWNGTITQNTLLHQSFNPIELYGVNTNTPQTPGDWAEYMNQAIGDYSILDSTSLEGTTGVNLCQITDGNIGSGEQGKTKIQIEYRNAEEMPEGYSGRDAKFEPQEYDSNKILLKATIYLNKTYLTTPGFIVSVIQKELLRALRFQDSPDPDHEMNGASQNKVISKNESDVLQRAYNMPRLWDMAQYHDM